MSVLGLGGKKLDHLQKRDFENVWHPSSQMKDYEEFPPIVAEKARGAYIFDKEGKPYLDAISSGSVNVFGHSNERLNHVLVNQLNQFQQIPFTTFTHQPAIQLAETIVRYTPKGIEKVFFSENASTSVEVALKMSFQYHQQTGNARKKTFVGIKGSYHGDTIGALSVSSIDAYTRLFKPIMIESHIVSGPDCFRCEYGKERSNCHAECFGPMEFYLRTESTKISAVIIEPLLQCASGMRMYPPNYLKKLREACFTYDIHMIVDEVSTGMGRTGKMFAIDYAQVTPDILCVSKGLTGGYFSLGLTLVHKKLYDAFYDDYTEMKTFIHGSSFSGNPLACALANEVLMMMEEEKTLEQNIVKASFMNKLIKEATKQNPWVGEVRQLGMVVALELVEDRDEKIEFDWKKRIGFEISKIALKKGLLLRPIGNILYFMPPYIIGKKEIKFMIETTLDSMEEYVKTNRPPQKKEKA
jgi:adenosylmethionine-8-amino-7-oxononanoate aminotransferase